MLSAVGVLSGKIIIIKLDDMAFPQTRLRRLRQNMIFRDMIRETEVNCDDLIMP